MLLSKANLLAGDQSNVVGAYGHSRKPGLISEVVTEHRVQKEHGKQWIDPCE